jgi:D-galactose 1-dehydrogenase
MGANLRLGIVGLGHVAEAQIAALQAVEGIDLVAATDLDHGKAVLLPNDARFFPTLDALLRDTAVECVLVSVPNVSHFAVARQVLDAGRPCIVEKPATETREDYDALAELAALRGVRFDVALHASEALEVDWWREHFSDFGLGALTGFECGFFDPYIAEGCVLPQAKGLGGSWFDSGINALSVVARFLPAADLHVAEARMTVLPNVECQQVQGAALFRFEIADGGLGRGHIDTNWTLGANRKTTSLFYGTDAEVVLDHSQERLKVLRRGQVECEKSFATGRARLANHYLGVFADLRDRFRGGSPENDFARSVHDAFFSVLEKAAATR